MATYSRIKNWVTVSSAHSVKTYAVLYILVETTKSNHIWLPYYFEYLLSERSKHADYTGRGFIHYLLSWSDIIQKTTYRKSGITIISKIKSILSHQLSVSFIVWCSLLSVYVVCTFVKKFFFVLHPNTYDSFTQNLAIPLYQQPAFPVRQL